MNPEQPAPPSDADGVALIVLAAGRGRRMRSALPKPLHPVAGWPMIDHVLRAGAAAAPARTVVVVGEDAAPLVAHLAQRPEVAIARQVEPLGTGDAVRRALSAAGPVGWLLVLFADHPLLTEDAVVRLVGTAKKTRALVTVMTVTLPDAAGYGRIERDQAGRPTAIVEQRDDDPARRVGPTEINSGMMVLRSDWASDALGGLPPSSVTGEHYLTDLVGLAVAAASGDTGGAWPVATQVAAPEVALGVNDRAELARADGLARQRIRQRLMAAGVTLVGAETIFVDEGVEVGADSTILPFSILSAGTTIGAGCEIGPQAVVARGRLGDRVVVRASTIEDSSIADDSDVGPYSHLRGGTEIGPRSHVGNFAELKNAHLGEGVKVGHFSYLGDAEVGARANIGAGTVTANFDGRSKHRTTIGADAFIGSDTILRAPVRVGAGASTGAGSVVTKDVADHGLVVGVPARPVRAVTGAAAREPEPGSTGGGAAPLASAASHRTREGA